MTKELAIRKKTRKTVKIERRETVKKKKKEENQSRENGGASDFETLLLNSFTRHFTSGLISYILAH